MIKVSTLRGALRDRLGRWATAPDGKARPDAPFGRGPFAARVLGRVIDAAAFLGCRLPRPVASVFAAIGGHAEWALRPGKRRTLAENLAHAIGSPPSSAAAVRDLVRREVVNEARRSVDLLWAIGRPTSLLANVEVIGVENAVAALARGKGMVLAGAHVGGWEVVAAVPAAVLPAPTTVLVADNWLAWAIQHVRTTSGLRVAYRTASPVALARVLQRGEALLVLGDDATGADPRRHRVRFCDSYAALPSGVVTLARLTEAPIVPFAVLPMGPRRWRGVLEPPIEPPPRDSGIEGEADALQQLADRWGALVQAHPDQWAASFPIAWDTVR